MIHNRLQKYQLLLLIIIFLTCSITLPSHTPSNEIVQLCETLDPSVDSSNPDAINKFFQTKLLRKPGKERWQIKPSPFEDQKEKILPILEQMGMIHEIRPQKKSYDIAFFFGATGPGFCGRSAFFNRCLQKIENKPETICITSLRPRFQDIETEQVIFDKSLGNFHTSLFQKNQYCINEFEIAQIITARLIKDDKIRDKMQFVAAPLIENPDGTTRRANTAETFQYFFNELKKNKQQTAAEYLSGKSILVISDNPHCLYQDTVARIELGKAGVKNFNLETVGRAVDTTHPLALAVMLDAIARTFYCQCHTNYDCLTKMPAQKYDDEFRPRSQPEDA